MSSSSDVSVAKEAAGKAAVEFVKEGMVVGLGTGTTAAYFIFHLGRRCREGLKISAVATSKGSHDLALEVGIPILDVNSFTSIDLTVDGADEIDPKKRMIKGGGGALLREKIIAGMSEEMVVIVDESKLVDHLGKFPLAVEIYPFGYRATFAKLEKLGYSGSLRRDSRENIFLSENGNYIVDISLSFPCLMPEKVDEHIQSIPGVLETGFFFNMAGRIIVGFPDGHVKVLTR